MLHALMQLRNQVCVSPLCAAPSTVADSRSMPPSGPPALGPSSLIAAAAGPIPSSPATAENSMFSGAPLYGCATPMDGGAPRNQPMPTRHLDLGGAVYPLYSQMDAVSYTHLTLPTMRRV